MKTKKFLSMAALALVGAVMTGCSSDDNFIDQQPVNSGKTVTLTMSVGLNGGGIVAVYNEDLIIDAMVKYGYKLREARNFANDGCWEVQVPGKTFFGYISIDFLQILQK